MAAPTTKKTGRQDVSVFLAAGTHTWVPTPESESFQDEVFEIMRAHHAIGIPGYTDFSASLNWYL